MNKVKNIAIATLVFSSLVAVSAIHQQLKQETQHLKDMGFI